MSLKKAILHELKDIEKHQKGLDDSKDKIAPREDGEDEE